MKQLKQAIINIIVDKFINSEEKIKDLINKHFQDNDLKKFFNRHFMDCGSNGNYNNPFNIMQEIHRDDDYESDNSKDRKLIIEFDKDNNIIAKSKTNENLENTYDFSQLNKELKTLEELLLKDNQSILTKTTSIRTFLLRILSFENYKLFNWSKVFERIKNKVEQNRLNDFAHRLEVYFYSNSKETDLLQIIKEYDPNTYFGSGDKWNWRFDLKHDQTSFFNLDNLRKEIQEYINNPPQYDDNHEAEENYKNQKKILKAIEDRNAEKNNKYVNLNNNNEERNSNRINKEGNPKSNSEGNLNTINEEGNPKKDSNNWLLQSIFVITAILVGASYLAQNPQKHHSPFSKEENDILVN
jgi:hypothetical protein